MSPLTTATIFIDAARMAEATRLFGLLLLTLAVLFVPIAYGVVAARSRLGPVWLRSLLGGSTQAGAVGKGLAIGAMTPFCGCSSVPVLAGLLQAGVRFSAITAFFMASPLVNPFIVVTVGVLFGPTVAVVYAVFALGASAAVAVAWERLRLDRWLRTGVGTVAAAPAAGVDSPSPKNPEASRGGRRAEPSASGDGRGRSLIHREAWGLIRPMVGPLVIGALVGAVLYGAVPEELVMAALDPLGPLAVPVAALMGTVLYLRGEAAIPVGAGLLGAGVPAAPTMAMVIGGMAASLPELIMLRGLFTGRLLAAYVATVLAVAVVAGALFPTVLG